jgi:GNAT superfamily N-acetyltransferase
VTSENDIVARAATPEDADGLAALFERADHRCHCRYWHFTGTSDEWLGRMFNTPEVNEAEFRGALDSGAAEARGVVALADHRVIGWMKLAAAETVQKLYKQRVYRTLPCFDGDRAGVVTVGCFLVDPEWRRHGVASRLLACGVQMAREAGAVSVEAFPYSGASPQDHQLWTGPEKVFTDHGFSRRQDFDPYPVLRLVL